MQATSESEAALRVLSKHRSFDHSLSKYGLAVDIAAAVVKAYEAAMIPVSGLDESVLEDYLDESIAIWRESRDTTHNSLHSREAECYVDAFQLVREAFLGSTLPVADDPTD